MPCYHPLTAFRAASGEIVFADNRQDTVRRVELPCGQCVGCRLERSRQWAVRCVHEAQCHEVSSFVTLTYSEEFASNTSSLCYRDYQLFMKRLIKAHRSPVRFFMCGEYGELGRPHFHALLFGIAFVDRKHLATTAQGMKLYRSAILERLWPFGHSSVGDVSFESAAYVARYQMKKVTGNAARDHYSVVDLETGEISMRVPEFAQMSRKPGIGSSWLRRYVHGVYPRDYVVSRGVRSRVPRYYDKMYKRQFPLEFEDVAFVREMDALERVTDNSDARLVVKEQVTSAKVQHLRRSLK